MKCTFLLRLQDSDHEVAARKFYMSLEHAARGYAKVARDQLGDGATWVSAPEQLFGGYWRNPRGDVLEMRY